MNQYKSIDIFDLAMPSGTTGNETSDDWLMTTLDNKTGVIYRRAESNPLSAMQTVTVIGTRALVNNIRNFLDLRVGRLNTFWMPVWRQEMRLKSAATVGTDLLKVWKCGLVDAWTSNRATRYELVLTVPGSAWTHVVIESVDAAVAPEPDYANEEVVTLTTNLAANWPVATTRIWPLRLWRLADDVQTFTWLTPSVAEFTMTVRECPWEISA